MENTSKKTPPKFFPRVVKNPKFLDRKKKKNKVQIL